VFDHPGLATKLAGDKLDAYAIESACHLLTCLWRLWHVHEVPGEVESIVPLLQLIDDSDRNATIGTMPIEIGDPLSAID
jgi:hypothetical protein